MSDMEQVQPVVCEQAVEDSLLVRVRNFYERNRTECNVAMMGCMFILVLFNILQALIMNLILLVYISFQTLEQLHKKEPSIVETKRLLERWVVYSIFLGVEYLCDTVLIFFPMWLLYPFAKLSLYIWVIYNPDNVNRMYRVILSPLYFRYRNYIRRGMLISGVLFERLKQAVDDLLVDWRKLVKSSQLLNRIASNLSVFTILSLAAPVAKLMKESELRTDTNEDGAESVPNNDAETAETVGKKDD